MEYKHAMENISDHKNWDKALDDEHAWMVKMKVWNPVESNLVPSNAKIITSLWQIHVCIISGQ